MGVFVIDGGDNWKVSLATGKPEFKEVFLKACRAAVETQKRVNAKWATVVPGYFARELPIGLQTGHVIDALRAGAEILEPSGLAMVLEPLSDNPDLFLRTSDQSYAVCRAVEQPVLQDPVRHVPHAAERRRHGEADRARVERDRLLPDRRQPRPQGARHGRDELPAPLQVHPRQGAAIGGGTSCSAWSTGTRSPAPKASGG